MVKNLTMIAFRPFLVSVCTAGFLLSSTNAFAGSGLTINGIDLDHEKEDFLEQLIELDSDDIDELRDELSEAREDVLEAIEDIEEAREEVKNIPGAGFFVKLAFKTAGKATARSVGIAFDEVRIELDSAESELYNIKDTLATGELEETLDAITVLRIGLSDLELAIGDLAASLNG